MSLSVHNLSVPFCFRLLSLFAYDMTAISPSCQVCEFRSLYHIAWEKRVIYFLSENALSRLSQAVCYHSFGPVDTQCFVQC